MARINRAARSARTTRQPNNRTIYRTVLAEAKTLRISLSQASEAHPKEMVRQEW